MIIPDNRRPDWTGNVGVPGGIPVRETIYSNIVTDRGADPTGVVDTSDIIEWDLINCPANQVVFMPAGTFLWSDWVRPGNNKNNYTLRGALGPGGEKLTTIKSGGSNAFLLLGDSQYPAPNATQAITAGATKGSTTFTMANTDEFYVGFPIGIAPAFPNWGHNLGGLANDARTFRVTFLVVSKTATTVTFTPPCPFDFSGMDPYAQPYYGEAGYGTIKGVGVEDLIFDMSGSTAGWAIGMNQAYGCWVKNVDVIGAYNRQMRMNNAIRCEFRQVGMFDVQNPGPNHEGLDFDGNCCWNHVEDCISVEGGAPPFIFGDSQGANSCNVVSYCYSRDTSPGFWDTSFNHCPHNALNLVEGCDIDWHECDGYFGSCSHGTIFRNRIRWKISLKHFSNYYNIVGNVLGSLTDLSIYKPANTHFETEISGFPGLGINPIYDLGYPNIGNADFVGEIAATTPPNYSALGNTLGECQQLDRNVKATLLRHGNWDVISDAVLWDEGIADHDIPDSLVYASEPAWWPEGVPWPPIGSDLSPMNSPIPAEIRFLAMFAPAITYTIGQRNVARGNNSSLGFLGNV